MQGTDLTEDLKLMAQCAGLAADIAFLQLPHQMKVLAVSILISLFNKKASAKPFCCFELRVSGLKKV